MLDRLTSAYWLSLSLNFGEQTMKQRWVKYPLIFLCGLLISLSVVPAAGAFCGFFVAKADSQLYNSSSQVIIAHQGKRKIFFMANDYQGDVQDFARIVPIPVIPKREQVRISNNEIIQALDDFTAPRLVEYVDKPCTEEFALYGVLGGIVIVIGIVIWLVWLVWKRGRWVEVLVLLLILGILTASALPSLLSQANKAKQVGPENALNVVTVEDQFTVGEYDITILSANESNSLSDWLINNGYKIPANAKPMLQSYIQQGMKFFVTRVNLQAFQEAGYGFLRPIVLDYESDQFMLPIRLGTLNAQADQDLTIHILSPNAYAEVANYRTLLIPTDAKSTQYKPSGEELPAFIKDDFGNFYQSLFQQEYERSGKNAAFLEYAGPLGAGKCDPCSVGWEQMQQLTELLQQEGLENFNYVTRLHVRYNEENFPEDLIFQEVSEEDMWFKVAGADKYFQNRGGVVFQGRYVIRRADNTSCLSGLRYYRNFKPQWANNLAKLTGWNLQEIQKQMK